MPSHQPTREDRIAPRITNRASRVLGKHSRSAGLITFLPDGPLLSTDDNVPPELWEETDGGLVQRTVTALGEGVFRADSVTPGASYLTRTSSLSRGWYHS